MDACAKLRLTENNRRKKKPMATLWLCAEATARSKGQEASGNKSSKGADRRPIITN
jgi:hypothetical protein